MAKDDKSPPPRAALDLSDLDASTPAPVPKDPASVAAIKQASDQAGFPSRDPAPKRPRAKRVRTRPKTGRTYPFNTKIKPETYDKICELADTATETEGRVVSMAEIIERAVHSLDVNRGPLR
ncbi:hypothetical protein [Pelagibius sp. Alg239-R121]|uniref:hypothetical protein n=1 Tax=Pelagibius sp. Alg239-R121 TaxID=2993448 RepID=UPI0024A6B88C|nr:hypothetical protein [Pelagibius sp. Alg239-R121]